MKKFRVTYLTVILGAGLVISSCNRKESEPPAGGGSYKPTPYTLNIPITLPKNLLNTPADNPLTEEGVALGKKLFYENLLSADNSMACASCHKQEYAFSDAPKRFSTGIDGIDGDRNAMALFNLGFGRDFFWDGRSTSLESQALEPVKNPIEMHQSWKDAVGKLKADANYTDMFEKAFGTRDFDSSHVSKAIAQFIRIIFSGNSRFQRNVLTDAEKRGQQIFVLEDKGDCFHCHTLSDRLLSDNSFNDISQRFHNNGLDTDPMPGTYTGRGKITLNPADNGKFKTPSLLNISLTPPYMHDGRFQTLEEVINFYDSGVHVNSNLDPNMGAKAAATNRTFENNVRKLHLTPQEKSDLLAFLKSFTDSTLITNPAYRP